MGENSHSVGCGQSVETCCEPQGFCHLPVFQQGTKGTVEGKAWSFSYPVSSAAPMWLTTMDCRLLGDTSLDKGRQKKARALS